MLPEKPIIILDTNILFSALLRSESNFADVVFGMDYNFFICELVLVELFKRKEKIVKLTQLTEEEVIRTYHIFLKRINLYKEDLITIDNLLKAYELCRDVDETDTPHVALTMELNGLLWTGDKKLKLGLKQKGFTQFFEPSI
ncbi:MAG: PIN domain-containing protein [Richelia sp. RM2_1_2]|nr:PIN domain-containing protein [Rivularia sp. T60_A2020_040]NJM19368.1 PIN domain-containing protein [Richelia sp. SM1_7_0]NJN10170.1 PIN domain-containing protein [Richelia sp. RM1_1_1]NJO57971.1 PIN domain-containing protein [Richelia sp. RM2_1_2]